MSKTVEFITRSVDAQIAEAEIPFRTVAQELLNARTVEGDRLKLKTITGNLVPIVFRDIPLYKTVKGKRITKENLPVLVVGNHANPDEDISEVTASLTNRYELSVRIGHREFHRPYEFPGGHIKVLFPHSKIKEIPVHLSKGPVTSPNCLGLKLDPDGISAFPIRFPKNFRAAFKNGGFLWNPQAEVKRIEAAKQDLFSRIIPLEQYTDPQAASELRKLLENDPREFFFRLWNTAKHHPAREDIPKKPPDKNPVHLSRLTATHQNSGLVITINRFHIYPPSGPLYGREITISVDPLFIPEGLVEDLDALIRAKDENRGGRLNLSLLQINKPEIKKLEVKSWLSRRNQEGEYLPIKESANYFSQPEQLCQLMSLIIRSL